MASVRLEGMRCRLRPIRPADYPALYEIELAPDLALRWRFRGGTPSPEHFARSLFEGVLATFVIESSDGRSLLGVVTAYNADMANGHCFIAAAATPAARGRGQAVEGLALFVDYCFSVWPFRKLWIETTEHNLVQFQSVERFGIEVEGRLRDFEYLAGRYWDKIILSIERRSWEQRRQLFASGGATEVATFIDDVARRLDIAVEELSLQADLSLDLQLDSLEWFVVVVTAEAWAGAAMPPGLLDSIKTVGDVVSWVEVRRSQSLGAAST